MFNFQVYEKLVKAMGDYEAYNIYKRDMAETLEEFAKRMRRIRAIKQRMEIMVSAK